MADKNPSTCSVPGCAKVAQAHGWCPKHYMRFWRTGRTAARTAEERFWAKVEKRGPDECWPWKGWTNRSGHGQFNVSGRIRKSAHVFAWTSTNGPLPAGKPWGLHRCDNPPCCNPAHIFPGTNKDNSADRHAKGRDARGDEHGMTKIPESAMPSLRTRLAAGERPRDIARDLGVAEVTVAKIKYGSRRRPAHARSVP